MNLTVGFIGLGALIFLMLLRMPIAIAMGVVSFGGITVMFGAKTALGILTSGPYEFAASWSLSSIPMFVFMGYLCYYSGITDSLFQVAKHALRRLNGGLGVAAIGGAAAFSAVSGSSIATAAAMGRIAVPEMVKDGYKPAFAGAIVAVGGTLGTMIPPSIIMIIYGIFTEASISKLFMAGIIPGLLSALMFCVTIALRSRFDPALVGGLRNSATRPLDETPSRPPILDTWPILMLFVCIMGGLFAGLFSAEEAGAVGAFISLIIAYGRSQFNWRAFKSAVIESLETTASIFFIGIGAILFTRFLALSGVSDYLAEAVIGITTNPLMFIIGVSLLYLLLGMFIDPIGIMLLTLPLLFPIMLQLQIDLIWMGILVVKLLELAMITPPVGMNLFVIKSMMPDTSLEDIIRQAVWFIVADIVTLSLLIGFPVIATFLPSLIK